MNKEKKTIVEELHAPARRFFPRRRVIVRGFDDLWQADIIDVQRHAKDNREHPYILAVIDVFSKYAWAIPLKSKNARDVCKAFATVVQTDGRVPNNLQTDMGKEFYNKDFQEYLKKRNVNHYSTFSMMKASVVERFNRTLKNNMWKYFSLNGSYRWIDVLPTLIDEYNRRKHRTINMRPIDVTRKNAKRLLSTVYSNVKIAGPAKYVVGDYVRVSKFKTVFDKGYTPNWSTEIFKIEAVKKTNPVTYLLVDSHNKSIQGGFYEYELHTVKYPNIYLVEKVLRKKSNKVYVKWLGFDNSHNSWISK